jgi:hypothetical protein
MIAALNPRAEFSQAGTTLVIANVIKAKPSTMVTRIEVNKDQTIKAFSEDNALVRFTLRPWVAKRSHRRAGR